MEFQWWLIFDAAVVLIAAYLIFSNARRGLTKVFILNIGYVFAMVLAGLVAVAAGPQIYDLAVRDENVKAFEQVVDEVNIPKVLADAVDNNKSLGFKCDPKQIEEFLRSGNTERYAVNLYHSLNAHFGESIGDFTSFEKLLRDAYLKAVGKAMDEKLPRYVRMNFEQQIAADPDVMAKMLEVSYAPGTYTKKIAETYEAQFGEEPCVEILRMFVYAACFAVIMIIAAVLSAAFKNSLFFNVTQASERTYGALLGIAETVALVILFTILIRVIVMLGGGDILIFNDTIIKESKLFSVLYNNLSALM